MRKAVGTMSLRLTALCRSYTSEAHSLHSASAVQVALQRMQSRMSAPHLTLSKMYSAQASKGWPSRASGAHTQSAVRPTHTSAYAAQSAFGQAPESAQKIESMPWDAMAANAVSLIGNTGRDVEIKRLETGRTVGNVTLACTHKAGETTWYNVEIWGPMAERVASQVSKGSQICIQGRLNPVNWTNTAGVKQTKLKVVANEVRFVYQQGGSSGQRQGAWGQQPGPEQFQQQQQPAWGGGQDTFEQAPLPGSEWGRANNVVPSQQADAPASPLTMESSAEEKWKSVIDSPQLWWDNTANKRNPRAPDFKLKDDTAGSIALWISSHDTPEWARQKMESTGVIPKPRHPPSTFTDMN